MVCKVKLKCFISRLTYALERSHFFLEKCFVLFFTLVLIILSDHGCSEIQNYTYLSSELIPGAVDSPFSLVNMDFFFRLYF